MDAYSGGWLLYVCQEQMPGTVVSTRHTLKHNTAAFSASGRWVEKGRRRREEQNKQKRTRKKTGHKNEREIRRQTVEGETEGT